MLFKTFMTDSSGTEGLEYLIYPLFSIFLDKKSSEFSGDESTKPISFRAPLYTAVHFSCASWYHGQVWLQPLLLPGDSLQ